MRRAILVLLALAACDGGARSTDFPYQLNWGPAGNTLFVPLLSEIEGDWLICRNAGCRSFDATGIRLAPGGVMQVLHVLQQGNDGTPVYCTFERNNRWTYDGTLLSFPNPVDGDPMSVRIATAGSKTFWTLDVPGEERLMVEVVQRPLDPSAPRCPVFTDLR